MNDHVMLNVKVPASLKERAIKTGNASEVVRRALAVSAPFDPAIESFVDNLQLHTGFDRSYIIECIVADYFCRESARTEAGHPRRQLIEFSTGPNGKVRGPELVNILLPYWRNKLFAWPAKARKEAKD